MAVLHDYVCKVHGQFEAMYPECPSGCGDGLVEKVFLKPVGMVSTFTKNADTALRGQVEQFGMTDVNAPVPANRTMSMDDLKRTHAGTNRMGDLPANADVQRVMKSLIPDAGKQAVIHHDRTLGTEVGGLATVTSQRPTYTVAAACDKSGQITHMGAK
jgi:hypothetical protein